MSDKPNRATRELAAEMAERMGMTTEQMFDHAMSMVACVHYNLDQIIDPAADLKARDYLAIVRQLPTNPTGQSVTIRLPEHATLQQLPDEPLTFRAIPAH